MKRAAIYARVSTDDKGQDPQNQLSILRPFAAQLGLEVTAEYVDEASGKNSNRPGFKALLQAAERHEFEVVLFWSLDRLTREGVWMTLSYLRRLSSNGIGYKSYTEQYIDSLGVFGDAIVGILAAVAQQERIRMSDRTKAGLARVKANGVRLGRPHVPRDKASRTTMWRRQREAA